MGYSNDNLVPSYDKSDEALLNSLPNDLLETYKGYQREGILGAGGVDSLTRDATRTAFLKAQTIEKALRKSKYARGLGGRAGSVTRSIYGDIYGGAVNEIAGKRLDINQFNEVSKSAVGTAGISNQMNFLQNRYNFSQNLQQQDRHFQQNLEFQKDEQDTGLLGGIGSIVGLGTDLYSAFNPAAGAVKAGIKAVS